MVRQFVLIALMMSAVVPIQARSTMESSQLTALEDSMRTFKKRVHKYYQCMRGNCSSEETAQLKNYIWKDAAAVISALAVVGAGSYGTYRLVQRNKKALIDFAKDPKESFNTYRAQLAEQRAIAQLAGILKKDLAGGAIKSVSAAGNRLVFDCTGVNFDSQEAGAVIKDVSEYLHGQENMLAPFVIKNLIPLHEDIVRLLLTFKFANRVVKFERAAIKIGRHTYFENVHLDDLPILEKWKDKGGGYSFKQQSE